MSACGHNLGGLGTCFTISHPIGCYNRHNYRNTKYLQLNPIVLHNLTYICPWRQSLISPRSDICSIVAARNPSTREARYHIPKRERQEDRTFLALSGDRAAGAVWLGGVDLGKYRRINIQYPDGEKHGLFRSCCFFFPASCNKMPQIFPSRLINCHSGSDRGKLGKIEAPLLTIVKGR